jgi:AcrR family transcriptional regulator
VSTKRLPAAKRKKQILMSAIRVFARSTYHGATTKAIAEEAGVTEALIYRYFGSKRHLFKDAIVHTAGRLIEGVEEILQTHNDNPIRAFTECYYFYVHVLEKHQDFAKMIFQVLAELDQPDIRETYLPYQERGLTLLRKSIARWQELGLVDDDLEPEASAWLSFGSYMILALVKHSLGSVQGDVNKVVKFIRPLLSEKGMLQLHEFHQTAV